MAKATIPIPELNQFDLPSVCLVTGSEEGVTFHKRRLLWTPPWVYLLILVPAGGLLLAAVVSMIVRRRAEAELPFSELGWSRYQQARWVRPLSVVFLILGWVFGMMFLASDEAPYATLAPILLILAMVVPVATYFVTRKWVVVPTRISQTHVDLRIGSDVAALRIAEHLRAGGSNQDGGLTLPGLSNQTA